MTIVEPARALVVVDVQRGFVSGDDAVPGAAVLLAAVSQLVDAAREAGALVVHLRNDGPPGAVDEPGAPGWPLQVAAADGESVIGKRDDDGFHGTDLDARLRARHIRTLVVCGVLSEMCVSATVRGAMERGYRVVLPHDAHATYDVPPGPGGSPPVPAAWAARAAEWALGDEIEIVARVDEIVFAP